jgi:hypothetical protein
VYKLQEPEPISCENQNQNKDVGKILKIKKIKKTNMREDENPECKSSLDALSKL